MRWFSTHVWWSVVRPRRRERTRFRDGHRPHREECRGSAHDDRPGRARGLLDGLEGHRLRHRLVPAVPERVTGREGGGHRLERETVDRVRVVSHGAARLERHGDLRLDPAAPKLQARLLPMHGSGNRSTAFVRSCSSSRRSWVRPMSSCPSSPSARCRVAAVRRFWSITGSISRSSRRSASRSSGMSGSPNGGSP